MSRYPAGTPIAALAAPWFTFIKWIFVYGSFGVLAIAALVAIMQALRRKSSIAG